MQSRLWKSTQLNKKRRKLSDSGFSLVELLIAVTILAIIVIPLLHMFLTSAKINVKSRQTLRATTVAQDIMEGLKAYTLEEVRAQFEPPEGMDGSSYYYPQDGFYVVNSSLIEGGVKELTELETEGSEIYYFGIRDIQMQGGKYDALIELDASAYGEKAANGEEGAHDNEFNGTFYAEIGSVAEVNGSSDEASRTTDSSYHQNKDLDEDVLKDVKPKLEADLLSVGLTIPDDLKLEDILMKRNITVVIEKADALDSEGNEQCKATITFEYVCSYNYDPADPDAVFTYTSYGYAGSAGGEVKDIHRTFSSGNFYLFYYPVYSSGEIDNIEFKIDDADKLFDEEQPLLKSVVLAKQIRSDVDTAANVIAPELSDAELQAKESAYRANVGIVADASMASDLTFRTNVDMNMVKNASGGEREMIGGIRYSFNSKVLPHLNQCTFSGDKVGEKVINVIYDIKISVYETGAAEHFTEINFEDNEDVHKLAAITNLD